MKATALPLLGKSTKDRSSCLIRHLPLTPSVEEFIQSSAVFISRRFGEGGLICLMYAKGSFPFFEFQLEI